jgi:hypothetical protein
VFPAYMKLKIKISVADHKKIFNLLEEKKQLV